MTDAGLEQMAEQIRLTDEAAIDQSKRTDNLERSLLVQSGSCYLRPLATDFCMTWLLTLSDFMLLLLKLLLVTKRLITDGLHTSAALQ